MQQTLNNSISLSGIGLHSGKEANLCLRPANVNDGITFIRTDMTDGKNVILARFDNVVDTRMCTVLANEFGASVGTIEHLMAALVGMGVDNCFVEIDGPEIPIMDGSAQPFVDLIEEIGLKVQDASRKFLKVLKEVSYSEDEKTVTLSPSLVSSFEGMIDFDAPIIGRQEYSTSLLNGNFLHDIARARTFTTHDQVDFLQSQGLALGGSLDNAIVFNDHSVLNPSGLRFEDECIRHKLLDAMGDLYLAGGQILGHYQGVKAGHYMNNMILKTLFEDPSAYEWCDSSIQQYSAPRNISELSR